MTDGFPGVHVRWRGGRHFSAWPLRGAVGGGVSRSAGRQRRFFTGASAAPPPPPDDPRSGQPACIWQTGSSAAGSRADDEVNQVLRWLVAATDSPSPLTDTTRRHGFCFRDGDTRRKNGRGVRPSGHVCTNHDDWSDSRNRGGAGPPVLLPTPTGRTQYLHASHVFAKPFHPFTIGPGGTEATALVTYRPANEA